MRNHAHRRVFRQRPVLERAAAWWNAGSYDADNGVLLDLSGRGHVATLTNAPVVGTTSNLPSITFVSASTQYLEVADHPDLDFALGDSFTVVYAGQTADNAPAAPEHFIGKKDGTANGTVGWQLRNHTAANARFGIADGTNGDTDTSPNLTNGQVFVLGAVRDIVADDIEIFLDGVGSGSPATDPTTGTLANALPLRMGADSGAAAALFTDGEFFAAALFREVLTDEEVRQVGLTLVGVG